MFYSNFWHNYSNYSNFFPNFTAFHTPIGGIPYLSPTQQVVGIRKKAESMELSANILKTLLA